MKKNNQWQKPDLSVMARNKKENETNQNVKDLYGLGVPPAPTPSAREIYGIGVPPAPPAISSDLV